MYINSLFKSIHRHCPSPDNNTIRCIIHVDSIFCALQLEWIVFELRNYIAGVTVQSNLCFISTEEYLHTKLNEKEFTQHLHAHIQQICQETGIYPIASGNYSFASSTYFAEIPSSNLSEYEKNIKNEREKASSEGWLSVISLHPQSLDYLSETTPKQSQYTFSESLKDYLHFIVKQVSSESSSCPSPISYKLLESDFLFCLQYLTSFLCGDARFPYTQDNKTLLTDANVFVSFFI